MRRMSGTTAGSRMAWIVWHAPTLTMNPTLPASVIEEARRLDPVSAATEFDAEWRDDVEGGYLAPQVVEGAVAPWRH